MSRSLMAMTGQIAERVSTCTSPVARDEDCANERWRAAVRFLAERAQPGDRAMTVAA